MSRINEANELFLIITNQLTQQLTQLEILKPSETRGQRRQKDLALDWTQWEGSCQFSYLNL